MRNSNNYLTKFFTIIILITILSCSTGYNKPADQYYEEGLLFFERMEYDRSIESFDKVLELSHTVRITTSFITTGGWHI